MREFTEQELVRREKVNALRELGIDPFGHRYDATSDSKEIKEKYSENTKEELEELKEQVKITGRIMTKRRNGKAGFFHIQDKYGKIQIYIRLDNVGEEDYNLFKASDLGDIVAIEGYVFKTNTGELSVHAEKYIHLVKALKPLPEKFHGLTDIEERYRRRYVDLIMNEDSRRVAFARPKIIRTIQNYLDDLGYTEVETPILTPLLTGAAARPFITHHNALNMPFYLRIATELNLKRLLVGGMDAVYEIGRIFRNEGVDRTHNPEFTTIELYKAFANLETMMDVCEGIFSKVCMKINGSYEIPWKGETINLAPGFKRIHMVDLIKEVTGVDFFKEMTLDEAKEIAREHNVEIEPHFQYGHIVNAFYEEFCEKTIIQPTFVYGHPVEISPLAKKSSDPRFTERFELFIMGTEYGNAFTELNDPIDQFERFENQLKERDLGNDEANDMDMDFVEALEYGMPPAGGMGIGIDRMIMLMTNSESIRDVLLFPHMKNVNGNNKLTKVVEKVDLSKVKIEPLFEEMVDFDTFAKSDFRAVKIESCKAVDKSDKLLKFTLNDGTEKRRTILSGIHKYYEPEELVGKTAIAIVNLPPRKMMGIYSEGMLISAVHELDGEERLNLLMVDDNIPAGAKLY